MKIATSCGGYSILASLIQFLALSTLPARKLSAALQKKRAGVAPLKIEVIHEGARLLHLAFEQEREKHLVLRQLRPRAAA